MSDTDRRKTSRPIRNGLLMFDRNYLLAICTSTGGTAIAVNTGTIWIAAFYVLSALTLCC